MSTKLKELQEAALAATTAARGLAEKADAENRSLSDDERHDYDGHMAKGRDLLEQIKVAKADLEVLNAAKSLADEIGPLAGNDLDAQADKPSVRERAKSLGLQVCDSLEFKAMMSPFKDGRIPAQTRIQSDPINIKGLVTGASDTSGGAFVVAEQTGIYEGLGRREYRLRDMISVRRTASDTVEYVAQTSHTNAAAPVPEATSSAAPTTGASSGAALTLNPGGGYKPEGSWAYERRTATVKTIAEWVPATKRALADVGQLEGLINDELRTDILEAEETQILSGNGTGENLTGILSTSGIQTQAFATDLFTSVRKGITKARTVGRVNPSAILMNPADLETVDLTRENGATGAYFGAGPFSMGPRTLWGLPTIESEAQPQGFALVGDFSKAVLWDREETTVTMTDSHADFFIRNLVAILAEERVAFAVTRPTAFVNVDVVA